MIGKVIMIITAVLLSINILSILIHLWLLRRRKYAEVPRFGYGQTYKYLYGENDDEE